MNPIRASDAEREQVASILQAAAGDGRLTTEEAGERLALANSARFRDELSHLVEDLPLGEDRPALPARRGRRGFWLLFGALRVAMVAALFITFWSFARFWMIWAVWPIGFLIFGALARVRYRRWGGPWSYRGWRGPRWRYHTP